MTKVDTRKSMAGVSIGDCVHVAGILNFLKLADSTGYKTVFIGVRNLQKKSLLGLKTTGLMCLP